MNLLLLHLFARDAAQCVVGAVLGTPEWYSPILSIPLRRKGGNSHFVVVLGAPGPFCFVQAEHPLIGVAMTKRFEHLRGLTVTGLTHLDGDRMIRLDLDADDQGRSHSLFLQLFGSRGRAILKRNGDTIESLPGRDRGEQPREGHHPGGLDRAEPPVIRAAIQSAVPTQTLVPGLDDKLIEVFSSESGTVDVDALIDFRDGIVGQTTPFDLVSRKSPSTVVPVPHVDGAADNRLGPFRDGQDACQAAGGVVLDRAHQEIVARESRPARTRLAALKKLTANLEKDLSRADDHGRVRREAEILAAYQSSIRSGSTHVDLADIYDPEVTVALELDPSLSIAAQIEKRFKKATKLEKSRAHATRRLELTSIERADIESALSSTDAAPHVAEALTRIGQVIVKFGLRKTQKSSGKTHPKHEPERTRRSFELSADWFAIVGRNNQENDELTFHVANPTDWWLHAQGVPGSHVILKSRGASGNPPRTILERAAAIAAHFSKSRHSSLVPVIYTQRKYVRKFRGAKAGQVRCEREKMVMVAPLLP